MSRRWFTSDQHFFHKNVIRFCNRPYSNVEEMNDSLIKNFNEIVRKGDITYILGDFSFGNTKEDKEILQRLNGTKILIKGNHDYPSARTNLEIGFRDVFENHMISIDKTPVLLSHFPYYPTVFDKFKGILKGYDLDKRYLHKRIINNGLPLMHGHIHCAYKTRDNMLNVGVDQHNFKPVSEEEILEWMNTLNKF